MATATAPKHSAWGAVYEWDEIAHGIHRVSTASHGGYHLSPERDRELLATFPNALPFAGACWYEEDCDWCFVAVCWPQFFNGYQHYCAMRTLKAWKREDYTAFIQTERGYNAVRMAQAFRENNADRWEITSSSCGPNGYTTSLRRIGDGAEKTVRFRLENFGLLRDSDIVDASKMP